MGWLKKMLNPLKATKRALDPLGLTKKGMKLTQNLVGGKKPRGSMQNPYESEMPSAAGMQEMQKPPVNLGPRAKPMQYNGNALEQDIGQKGTPNSKPVSKPYYAPGTEKNPIDQVFTVDQQIEPVDPKEEYFAANAARMKPMAPDMYSMRKNREQDKFYQRTRTNIR